MRAFAFDFVEGSVESQELREAATRGARTNAGMESAFARNGWKQDGILMNSDEERQGELAASQGEGGGHGRLWHNYGKYIAVVMQ